MSWRMRQARRIGRMSGVSELRFLVDKTPKIDGARMLGYLFRRFGYPERGWDGYKEACAYYLTTPDPRLILGIRITACAEPSINISFYAGQTLCSDISGEAALARWRGDMRAWFEANGTYPPWFDEFVRYLGTQMDPPLPPDFEIVPEDRHIALFVHAVWFSGPRPEGRKSIADRAGAFYTQVWEDYKKVQPQPTRPKRPKNWREWPEGDPLKSLAQAAEKALADLCRPVHVRDGAIDAYGRVRGDDWGGHTSVSEAKSAGYAPFGAFVNADPELACELAGAVAAFGKNNRRAMRKAIEILRAAAPKPRKKKETPDDDA